MVKRRVATTYKTGEFAELVGVHIRTLQAWDKKGQFPAHRTPAGRRYYTSDDLKKFRKGNTSSESK